MKCETGLKRAHCDVFDQSIMQENASAALAEAQGLERAHSEIVQPKRKRTESDRSFTHSY
ncbi:unnamed protein product [Cylicocyclus nassatus]|uniref:Uncharacterized protein n=1 Tax=Cylicocyclus nassatus TaxID=53992 RepID=A0AA36GM20_CYLNA|nr:unnamed protein product [Cylicocyclus nassatus]